MPHQLKTYLLWSVLVIAVATVSVAATIAVYQRGLFAPKDYEDCAESAAINAKSKDALSVLISVCRSKFSGRRKLGGGYTYYDSCTEVTYDINGPNPTQDDLKTVKRLCLRHMDVQAQIEAEEEESRRKEQEAAKEAKAKAQQSAQEARAKEQQAAQEADTRRQAAKLAVMTAIQVNPKGFSRSVLLDKWVDMKIDITNGSKWAVSEITVGFAFIPTNTGPCPTSFGQKKELYLPLSPGETRSSEIRDIDAELSKHRICIKVIDIH